MRQTRSASTAHSHQHQHQRLAAGKRRQHIHPLNPFQVAFWGGPLAVDKKDAALQDRCQSWVARRGVCKQKLQCVERLDVFFGDPGGGAGGREIMDFHATRVAGMARTPEDHLAAVRALAPELPSETVPLAQTMDRHVAHDVLARCDAPSFDNSQMDGYALPTAGATTWRVGPTVPAGVDPDEYYPQGLDCAAPVMTGTKLPAGTVAVVPVEACTPGEFVNEGAKVSVPDCPPGQFVRLAGSDISAGDLLAPAGAVVTPALIGALIGQGIDEVQVYRRARILTITGGKEIGGEGSASIPDSNGPILTALAQRHGIEVAGALRTDDDPYALEREVAHAVDTLKPDVIVTSGGISHGKFEVIRQVFTNGWYGHVSQQPGGPQGLSSFAGVPVLSLPGNPISTLVSFRLYVAPVFGHAPAPVWVPLSQDTTGLDNREQFLRGQLIDGRAQPIGGPGSHQLSQAAQADCLIRIPVAATLRAGELVMVYPL